MQTEAPTNGLSEGQIDEQTGGLPEVQTDGPIGNQTNELSDCQTGENGQGCSIQCEVRKQLFFHGFIHGGSNHPIHI